MGVTLARRSTMEKLVIEGGVPLSGTIVAAGNKNAALPLLAASLLTEERVEIANVPRIRDTEAMLTLLADLGVAVEWLEDNKVALHGGRHPDHRRRPDARRAHPRLLPGRRAAAGALRLRPDAAARAAT